MKPRDQVHQRGLPHSAQPYHGHHLPGFYAKRHSAQDPFGVVVILELDIAKLDRGIDRHQRLRPRTVLGLRVRIQGLEDALSRGDGTLDIGIHAAQLLDRTVHHQQGGHKRDELTDCHLGFGDLPAAIQQHPHDPEPADELHQRWQRGHRARDLHICAIEPLGGLLELALLHRLGLERLDDPMPRERFHGQVRQLFQFLLATTCRAPDPLPQTHQRVDNQRRSRDADQREPRVLVDKNGGEKQERQRLL